MNITHSATGASQERALPLQQPGFPGYKILIMKSLPWRADKDRGGILTFLRPGLPPMNSVRIMADPPWIRALSSSP